METKKFIGGLVIGLILGSVIGVIIEARMILSRLDTLTTIASEQRDALNCQTWHDESCGNADYWSN